MDTLYSFTYRGVLTQESLDRAGRTRKLHFGSQDAEKLHKILSFDMLDPDCLDQAQRMSVVYCAVHSFENMVRQLVLNTLTEFYSENWVDKIPDRIRKKIQSRLEEDSKFRWHGARGESEIIYCDFGDLSSIIVTNWQHFENILGNMEWAKAVLNTLEKSRNIVMHGGTLAQEDVERIGMNIRDWIRQAG